MAVVTTKSSTISGRDATPLVLANSAISRAATKRSLGVVAAVSGDSVGSKYQFESIPSNAVIQSVQLSSPDIGTTTAMDLGLYRTTRDGGAVVDADFFKAAIVLNAGATVKAEEMFGNVITVANMEQRLWQLLGLAIDPEVMYDVVGTLTGAADGSASIAVEVYYCE